jgi:NADPH:quinone reductase-like Zn-dependent oxidoreductase
MRAVRYDRFGPIEALRINEAPTPYPGPKEVLVEVHAASVDAAEITFRIGTHLPDGRHRGGSPTARIRRRSRKYVIDMQRSQRFPASP